MPDIILAAHLDMLALYKIEWWSCHLQAGADRAWWTTFLYL